MYCSVGYLLVWWGAGGWEQRRSDWWWLQPSQMYGLEEVNPRTFSHVLQFIPLFISMLVTIHASRHCAAAIWFDWVVAPSSVACVWCSCLIIKSMVYTCGQSPAASCLKCRHAVQQLNKWMLLLIKARRMAYAFCIMHLTSMDLEVASIFM